MIVLEIIPIDNKKRKVCLDSGYTFPLYISEMRKFKLLEGEEINKNTYDEIHQTLVSRVKNRIMYLLGDTDKSISSVRNKLRLSGYPQDVIDNAIDFCLEYGYLDDERFTRNYIDSMLYSKRKSRREIINGLFSKGIDRTLIDNIITEYEFNENDAIEALLKKKGYSVNMLQGLEQNTRFKLCQFLMRKGFCIDNINKIFYGNF